MEMVRSPPAASAWRGITVVASASVPSRRRSVVSHQPGVTLVADSNPEGPSIDAEVSGARRPEILARTTDHDTR